MTSFFQVKRVGVKQAAIDNKGRRLAPSVMWLRPRWNNAARSSHRQSLLPLIWQWRQIAYCPFKARLFKAQCTRICLHCWRSLLITVEALQLISFALTHQILSDWLNVTRATCRDAEVTNCRLHTQTHKIYKKISLIQKKPLTYVTIKPCGAEDTKIWRLYESDTEQRSRKTERLTAASLRESANVTDDDIVKRRQSSRSMTR